MTAGLEILSELNLYQITELYKNMQCNASGVASGFTHYVDGAEGEDFWYKDIVVYDCVDPFIAIGATTNWTSAAFYSRSGSTVTFRIFSTSDAPCNWYVFDVPTVRSSSGLEVNAGDGSLKFNSQLLTFKPKAILEATIGGGNASWGGTAYRNYAATFLRYGQKGIGDSSPGAPCTGEGAFCSQQLWMGCVHLADQGGAGPIVYSNAEVSQWKNVYKSGALFCGLFTGNQDQRILILDVTGG